MKKTKLFFLIKDEIHNLPRSLPVAKKYFDVIVYDSGSTDGSINFCKEREVSVVSYNYKDHYSAYSDIISNVSNDEYIIILDGDMILSEQLVESIFNCIKEKIYCVAKASVLLCHEGIPIPHAGMYPPKPILFRGGESPFIPLGHGEGINPSISVYHLKGILVNDDRKPFSRILQNQVFYAHKMLERYFVGEVNWRDRIRAKAPWIVPLVFIKSYIINRGFLDGKAGLLYAVDRVIVELIMYRFGLANKIKNRTVSS